MPRENISITQPNDEWLKTKLEAAENSGFTLDSKEQILVESKSLFNK